MVNIMTMAFVIAVLLIMFGFVLLVVALQAQGRRIKDLEEQLPRRHTHQNSITLENLAALVIGAQARNSEQAKMLESLREILASWRSDPNYRSEDPVH